MCNGVCSCAQYLRLQCDFHSSVPTGKKIKYLKLINHMPAGSKIVFANGSQDPWRHASKQKSSDECEHFYSYMSLRLHFPVSYIYTYAMMLYFYLI